MSSSIDLIGKEPIRTAQAVIDVIKEQKKRKFHDEEFKERFKWLTDDFLEIIHTYLVSFLSLLSKDNNAILVAARAGTSKERINAVTISDESMPITIVFVTLMRLGEVASNTTIKVELSDEGPALPASEYFEITIAVDDNGRIRVIRSEVFGHNNSNYIDVLLAARKAEMYQAQALDSRFSA